MPFIYTYNNLKNNNYVYKNYRIGNIVILYSYRRYHPLLCLQRQRSRNSTILSLCCTWFNCIGTYCRITFLTHKKSKKQEDDSKVILQREQPQPEYILTGVTSPKSGLLGHPLVFIYKLCEKIYKFISSLFENNFRIL